LQLQIHTIPLHSATTWLYSVALPAPPSHILFPLTTILFGWKRKSVVPTFAHSSPGSRLVSCTHLHRAIAGRYIHALLPYVHIRGSSAIAPFPFYGSTLVRVQVCCSGRSPPHRAFSPHTRRAYAVTHWTVAALPRYTTAHGLHTRSRITAAPAFALFAACCAHGCRYLPRLVHRTLPVHVHRWFSLRRHRVTGSHTHCISRARTAHLYPSLPAYTRAISPSGVLPPRHTHLPPRHCHTHDAVGSRLLPTTAWYAFHPSPHMRVTVTHAGCSTGARAPGGIMLPLPVASAPFPAHIDYVGRYLHTGVDVYGVRRTLVLTTHSPPFATHTLPSCITTHTTICCAFTHTFSHTFPALYTFTGLPSFTHILVTLPCAFYTLPPHHLTHIFTGLPATSLLYSYSAVGWEKHLLMHHCAFCTLTIAVAHLPICALIPIHCCAFTLTLPTPRSSSLYSLDGFLVFTLPVLHTPLGSWFWWFCIVLYCCWLSQFSLYILVYYISACTFYTHIC